MKRIDFSPILFGKLSTLELKLVVIFMLLLFNTLEF
jgi:hypothetical protein